LQWSLRELNKKTSIIISILLFLFAGILAMTDDAFTPPPAGFIVPPIDEPESEDTSEDVFLPYDEVMEIPEWFTGLRWFRSNKGGMALEEMSSQFTALRNEYALAINFALEEELPENLVDFYDKKYFIEIRTLYEKGSQIRAQWIFRDNDGRARLVAVFLERDKGEEIRYEEGGEDEEPVEIRVKLSQIYGFIEIYDENSFIKTEYRYSDDGGKTKIDFRYNNNLLITSTVSVLEDGVYVPSYADFFRYNRSSYLRAVERVFYKDRRLSFDEAARISFPHRIMDAAKGGFFLGERLHSYPEFFGPIYVIQNNKIIYTADERGRIMNQTCYDSEDNIVWVIENTWKNERIVSVSKKEGEEELRAEFEYDSKGDRILEKNLRNGNLERLVRTEGKTDIEELYMDNVLVLSAVWEEGRKISETRTGAR
jgi:hypothetical protein